jgi:hypothetical protein
MTETRMGAKDGRDRRGHQGGGGGGGSTHATRSGATWQTPSGLFEHFTSPKP